MVTSITAGPGVSNTLTALRNAQLAQSPLVLIGGAAPTALQGRGALQDIDQRALITPHVKHVTQVKRVRELGPATSEALRIAESSDAPVLHVEALFALWALLPTVVRSHERRAVTERMIALIGRLKGSLSVLMPR